MNRSSMKPSARRLFRETDGRGIAAASAGRFHLARVHERLQKRARRDNDGPGVVDDAPPALHPGNAAAIDDDGFGHFLAQ